MMNRSRCFVAWFLEVKQICNQYSGELCRCITGDRISEGSIWGWGVFIKLKHLAGISKKLAKTFRRMLIQWSRWAPYCSAQQIMFHRLCNCDITSKTYLLPSTTVISGQNCPLEPFQRAERLSMLTHKIKCRAAYLLCTANFQGSLCTQISHPYSTLDTMIKEE